MSYEAKHGFDELVDQIIDVVFTLDAGSEKRVNEVKNLVEMMRTSSDLGQATDEIAIKERELTLEEEKLDFERRKHEAEMAMAKSQNWTERAKIIAAFIGTIISAGGVLYLARLGYSIEHDGVNTSKTLKWLTGFWKPKF